jgi:single-stranded DNA-binding protein
MGINKSILQVKFFNEITIRKTQKDGSIAFFNASVGQYNASTKETEYTWLPFIAFGKTAELLKKVVKKNTELILECHQVGEEIVDNNNFTQYVAKNIVDKVHFISTPTKQKEEPEQIVNEEMDTYYEDDDNYQPF